MKNKKGFTLIELLIVVLIIGVLAAVALPQYQKAVERSRATQLVMASRAISDAQTAYYLANGVYAEKNDELAVSFPLRGKDSYTFGTGKGICSLDMSNANSGPRANCALAKPQLALQRFYKTNKIECCSYVTDNYAGDGLCTLITGKTTWTNNCGEDNGIPACHCYHD